MTTDLLSHALFLERARDHQRQFLARRFGCGSAAKNARSVHLPEWLAAEGANFAPLPAVRDSLRERFPNGWKGAEMPYRPLYYDMLRSQHIPFNLFGPLKPIVRSEAVKRLFSAILQESVSSVDRIHIEFAPKDACDLLGDNTCFDTFAAVTTSGGKGIAVGIEVKYTEGAYRWGTTERREMHNESSVYCDLTHRAGIFINGALTQLRTPRQKQMWRNQLLGEAVLQKYPEFSDYRYVFLHPGRSAYSSVLAADFQALLTPELGRRRFLALSYEEYLRCASEDAGEIGEVAWAEYSRERYLF